MISMFFIVIVQAGLMNLQREPYWYEVLGGIVLIPSLAVGAVLSWMLIKKTRHESRKFELEARKFELEIREKERQLGTVSNTENAVLHKVVESASQGRQIQFLILRFILLYILLRGWFLIMLVLEPLSEAFKDLADFTSYRVLSFPLFLLSGLFEALPTIGYLTTALVLGFPLFRDVNKLVGLKKLEDWFKSIVDEKAIKETNEPEDTDSGEDS
jgi:hypothetical protein